MRNHTSFSLQVSAQWFRVTLLIGLSLGSVVPLAQTRAQQVPNPPPQRLPGLSPNPTPPDSSAERMAARMARQRNADRQKQIVADTAHLLKLAQQLNTDVGKSNKNMLSLNVVKEAEEIEKLAKTIKDRMKEGY